MKKEIVKDLKTFRAKVEKLQKKIGAARDELSTLAYEITDYIEDLETSDAELDTALEHLQSAIDKISQQF